MARRIVQALVRDRLSVYPIAGQAYPPDEDRGTWPIHRAAVIPSCKLRLRPEQRNALQDWINNERRKADEMDAHREAMAVQVEPPPEIKRAVAWLEFELGDDDAVTVESSTDHEGTLIQISRAIGHQQILALEIRLTCTTQTASGAHPVMLRFRDTWRTLYGVATGKREVALGTVGKPQVGP